MHRDFLHWMLFLRHHFENLLIEHISQFRFECIEDRGCTTKKVEEFWADRKDLTNVYTWTFSRTAIRRISVTNSVDSATARQKAMGESSRCGVPVPPYPDYGMVGLCRHTSGIGSWLPRHLGTDSEGSTAHIASETRGRSRNQ